MRVAYNLLTWLLLLPYAVYWLVRGIGNRSYWPKLGQRFGVGYPQLERSIWIHAVSVGEVVAAGPLIRAVLREWPDDRVVVSTVTPTGAARVAAIFGDRVDHCYIPFETPFSVNRFFRSLSPRMALVMETEIWPNLYHGCGSRGIPLVLVSARISERSVRNYRRLLPLFRETLSHGIVIAAQSPRDAERFLSLGASPERTRVTGNIKFDIELPDDLEARGAAFREATFGARPVWVAASTHDGEEQQLLEAHRLLLERDPSALLVLVPRHPQRFAAARELLARTGLATVARTDDRPCDPETQVFLGDTMGEVTLFYAAGDVAFVGGSLVPIGGHNLLEPAALGRPIASGPHTFNAPEIANELVRLGGCRIVTGPADLAGVVGNWFEDAGAARRAGRAAHDSLRANRGALDRLLAMIRPLLA